MPLSGLVGVWDTREGPVYGRDEPYWRHVVDASAWADVNLPDAKSTYRAEFYLIDCPFAVVYEYVRDDQGRIRFDPELQGPVCAEPRTVLLDALPPAELLR